MPPVSVAEIHVDPDGWEEAIPDTDGPQLVVGGPGSGKTEFLVRRAHYLIADKGVPSDRVLLLSFSRRGAADLRRRLVSRLDGSFTTIPALTFHSLARRIVEAHGAAGDWPRPPSLLTGPEQVSLVARVLAAEDPSDWPLPYRALLTTRTFAEEVADFCLRAAERLIGPAEVEALGRDDWRGLPGFLDRYRRTMVEAGRIDYGSLQVEAVRLLADPSVGELFSQSVRYVLVDEYQDTTVAQARILETLVGAGGNIVAAGDPYQSVYSFRGAELANVEDFLPRFGGPEGAPARRLVLTTSFRVPRRILEAAVRVTAGTGLPGAAGPVTPAPGDGSVEAYRFDQRTHEAEWIAAELQRVHLLESVPYREMAVLLRSKWGLLPELSRALHRRRIPHDPPDARLVDHPAVRPVLDLAVAASRSEPERSQALRRVLLGPLVGLTLSAARELERRALRGEDWADILSAEQTPLVEIGALLADPRWAREVPAADGFWTVWSRLPGFAHMAGSPGRVEDRAALSSLSQALNHLRQRDPSTTLADYVESALAEGFEAEPLLEFTAGDSDRVTLTTLHQAKGMEFELVVVADAREGVLPDLRTRDSILGARHLSPTHGGDDADYARFRLQEEMRLAYTAICRARRRVVWTCTTESIGEEGGGASRLLPLVAGVPMETIGPPPGGDRPPTTPLEAEAWLRRRLRDPTLPAAERLAALSALVEEAPWRPRPPKEFAGLLPSGSDGGVIAGDPTLSPSQAESYDRCPRRYVFERRLRIDAGGSVYQELGSVLHRVLERVESQAAAGGRDHGSAAEAAAAFDSEFDPGAFGGGPWAQAWHRRASRILEHLYANWPGRGPAVACEYGVAREVDGIRWQGRIDRLERREDGVCVIDYKTGSSAVTQEEAASSIQLGFYAAAVEAHRVAGAEFWFPGHGLGRVRSVPVRRFDMERLDEVEERMVAVQRGILAEDWTPRPGAHCERGPVRIVCPAWPEGREAFAS